MLPVNSVLPGSCSHPMLPQSSVTYAFSKQPPLDLSLVSKKRYPSVFFRSPPGPTLRGTTFAVPAPPRLPPIPPSTEWKEFISRLLCTLPVLLHYHYSILRSSFFVLLFSRNLKNGPFITPCPSLPCRTVFHSCVRACGWRYGLVWVQTVWINRLLTFSSFTPYYIICILLAIVCTSSSCRLFLV
jgi:hypothetical protein